MRGSINDITTKLKYELEIAWQQVVQQGNFYPLIEFYNRHESKLKQDYDLSLDDLMEQSPNKFGVKPNSSTGLEVKNSIQNPLSSLIVSNPKKVNNKISVFSVLAFAAGAFLIVKSFKT